MLKKMATVALATAAFMVNATAAHADAPVHTCRFFATTADGVNFTGGIAGSITHVGGGDVSIQCYLRVNGSPAPGTFSPTGTGITTASTEAVIGFAADSFDIVHICTVYGTDHDPFEEVCFETVHQRDPSPFLGICDVTTFIGVLGFNILGLVIIEPDGDVIVAGSRLYNCATFDGFPVATRFG